MNIALLNITMKNTMRVSLHPHNYNWFIWSIGSALLSLYVFLLPLFANLFTQNQNSILCSSSVYCADGTSYYNLTGLLNGCGCGQGIFGQNVCAVTTYGYTISGFIATAPATGVMAILSVLPCIAIWVFGAGSDYFYRAVPRYLRILSRLFLVIFQCCYALFLFSTVCVFPSLHDYNVVIFAISAVLHYLIVAYIYSVYYRSRTEGLIIYGLSICASISFCLFVFFGHIYQKYHPFINQYELLVFMKYLPWLFECTGLTLGFSIAPVMLKYY